MRELLSEGCCHRLVGVYIALLVTSSLMAIWSYLDLFKDLVRHGKAQPLATRLAVCFALTLNSLSVTIGQGTTADRVLGITYAALSLLMVALTCRRKIGHIAILDRFCLVLSMFGAVLFLVSGKSIVGVLFAVAADLVGYVPTLRKCWSRPETQPYNTYLISLGAASVSLVAGFMYDQLHVTAIFTVYLVVIDALIPALIFIRKDLRKATASAQLQTEN